MYFGRFLCCFLPVFVNRQVPCPHKNSHSVLLLRATGYNFGTEDYEDLPFPIPSGQQAGVGRGGWCCICS